MADQCTMTDLITRQPKYPIMKMLLEEYTSQLIIPELRTKDLILLLNWSYQK